MAKASIPHNSPVSAEDNTLHADAVSLFFETLADIRMSDKEAAYTMVLDPAQLSRVKSGQARLPFDAIWRLPDRFWVEFNDRIAAARHLTPVNASAMRRRRIVELVDLLLQECA